MKKKGRNGYVVTLGTHFISIMGTGKVFNCQQFIGQRKISNYIQNQDASNKNTELRPFWCLNVKTNDQHFPKKWLSKKVIRLTRLLVLKYEICNFSDT